jgi:putative spermidine/putrescine transport system permease protein
MSTLRERSPASYALAGPAALWMLGALVAPTAFIVWVSLWATRSFSLANALTVANYTKFFARGAYVRVLGDTLQQAALMMAITGVLGYGIAYFLMVHVRSPVLRLGLFFVLVVPFWTSALIRTIAWIPFLGVGGVINQALLFLHVVDQPVEAFLYSRVGITLAQVSFYTLLATGPIVYTLRNIPPSLREAAQCLKATPARVFWRITVPLTLPGIVIGQILVFLNVMADFATAQAIGGHKYAFLGNLVILLYESGQLPFAAVIAVLLMASMLAGVAVLLKAVDIRRLGTP